MNPDASGRPQWWLILRLELECIQFWVDILDLFRHYLMDKNKMDKTKIWISLYMPKLQEISASFFWKKLEVDFVDQFRPELRYLHMYTQNFNRIKYL
jgi:hypothetical protein